MSSAEAHQRKIREQKAAADPRPPAASLKGYAVELIARIEAQPIIQEYEWLGTVRGSWFVGLWAPTAEPVPQHWWADRELQGVACFGDGPQGPNGGIRKLIGSPALCLERGACVHWAPPNAASYLITRACKLISEITGKAGPARQVHRFFAYADPEAGEYGGVYQAAGWAYLGQGLRGNGKRTATRTVVLPPGAEDRPENWRHTRTLRQGGRHLSYDEAERQGWRIIKDWEPEARAAKHVYATHVGADRKAWREGLAILPYPTPRPALKRKAPTVWRPSV